MTYVYTLNSFPRNVNKIRMGNRMKSEKAEEKFQSSELALKGKIVTSTFH